jgi:hypothetical protein
LTFDVDSALENGSLIQALYGYALQAQPRASDYHLSCAKKQVFGEQGKSPTSENPRCNVRIFLTRVHT